MAYRYGNRHQRLLFPSSIEDYIPAESPVRVYDAFVEALSLKDLDIAYNPHQMGNPEYVINESERRKNRSIEAHCFGLNTMVSF